MALDEKLLEEVAARKMSQGAAISENAAQGGFVSDHGGGLMRDCARFFLYGLRGELPPDWKQEYESLKKQKEKEQDKEYLEYVRLKNKFKGK